MQTFIGVDYFKRINDHRGHAVGDQVLKQLAMLVMNNIRSEDIFGRRGGEEFILLCPNTRVENAGYFAEKLREIISSSHFGEDKPLTVTASFGVGIINASEKFRALAKKFMLSESDYF
jgi:diguanylate cyclase (GGDEF)-like protein